MQTDLLHEKTICFVDTWLEYQFSEVKKYAIMAVCSKWNSTSVVSRLTVVSHAAK